ncbi:MAG: sulfatase [Bacteroidales bacterium]|nr:sulfatase [Bacteroidales bacterium]
MRKPFITLSAISLLSLPAISKDKPNIILFLVDDMGWEDTSVPFWSKATELNKIYETPNMERLASKGMKFTNAYACPVSSPSRVSLITGSNVTRHKVSNWTLYKDKSTDGANKYFDFGKWNYNGVQPVDGINQSFYSKPFPAILQENGYYTMIFGKAHFGALDTPAADPLTMGFDLNIGGHAAGAMGSYLGEENYGNRDNSEHSKVWGVPDLEEYHGSNVFLTEALTQKALKSMDKALENDKPFFLYMSHYAVHAPFAKDDRFYKKYREKGLSDREAQYAGLVEGMDKSLGDIMDYLEQKGIDDNTVVIFMSDNGGYTVGRVDKNYPLRGGKGSVFEGGIREPMIVSWPGIAKEHTICSTPIIIEDFFPTILEMAGAKYSKLPQKVDGKSFVGQLKGRRGDLNRPLYFHYPNDWGERFNNVGEPQSAVIIGDYKLIHFYETKTNLLYNIKEDISETNDLSKNPKYTKTLQKLAKSLSDRLRETKANMPIQKDGKLALYPDQTF